MAVGQAYTLAMLDFWTAYRRLRGEHVKRAEVVAVGVDVSVFTVRAWDMTASGSKDKHGRSPSPSNKVRLARLAEEKGAPKSVIAALEPST